MAKQITVEVVMRKTNSFGKKGVKDTDGKWWDFEPEDVDFEQGAVLSIEAATGPKKNRVTKFKVVKGGRSGGSSAPAGGGKAGGVDYSEVNWNASVARATEIVERPADRDTV